MRHEREISDHFLAVLVAGFAVLVLLLGLACYVAIGIMYPAETRAARRVEQERATAQVIDALHRDEDSLNGIFYDLATGHDAADRRILLSRLDAVQRELDRKFDIAVATDRARWAPVKIAAAAFLTEGRKVLASTGPPHTDFFQRHAELNEAVARFAAAAFADEREADRLEAERSARRIRYTLVLLAVAMVVALATAGAAIYATHRAMMRTRWQAAELQQLSSRVMSDLDAMARRFSHELHDQFGQTLTAIEANLVAMQNRGQVDQGRMEDCLGLIQDGIAGVREVSQLLRPSILDDFGLDAGLRWLVETYPERTGIKVVYESTFSERMDTEVETHVFRIAQEALTNAARHSGGTEVAVRLRRVDQMIRLVVADNGKGFRGELSTHGLGLTGMRARARSIHGLLMIVPGGDRGVTVLLEVPFTPPSETTHAG